MKFSFASFFTKLTLATSVAGALVSCEEPEYPTPSPVTESTVGQARILVVNAAPGSQGVTTTFENQPFGTLTPYLGSPVSTYTTANAGLRLFVFNDPANIPANPSNYPTVGTPPAAAPQVNTSAKPFVLRSSFAGGTSYTVFLTDQPTRPFVFPVTPTSDQGGIRTVTLTDNLAAPAAGRAKVRFVNLSPSFGGGADSLGLYNTATNRFLFRPIGRTYRATSYTVPNSNPARTTNFANFTEVAAGTYVFDVRRGLVTAPNTLRVEFTPQSFNFEAGKIYTVYTRGIRSSSTTPLGISVVQHN